MLGGLCQFAGVCGDLVGPWRHGRWLIRCSSSEAKATEQPASPPSPLPTSECPSSTGEGWSPPASERIPRHGPESGPGVQGGDPSDEDWRNQRKHVFVLSEAGKPIYSRYGSVEALSATMGVMTALVSFVQSAGDAIRAIYAGEQAAWGPWLGVWLPGSLARQLWVGRLALHACGQGQPAWDGGE